MADEKDAAMTFRLDAGLRTAFLQACKRNDESAAQVLRAAMRDYLAKHRQTVLPFPVESVAKKGKK